MGAWGEGLYDDDEACDVRDTISLLSKMPASGDEILELLLKQFARTTELDDDGAPTFWMVVADQFAKRGIECDKAKIMGMEAIDSGADLRDLKAREMEPKGLNAREKVHNKLVERINNPKPSSSRKLPKNPPKLVVNIGDIYSYPTMSGTGFNAWYSSWDEASFSPDGWGALIILATGRVFDWFPWAAYTPVVVNPHTEPIMEDVISAKTLFSDGVAYFAPKKSHMRKMEMKLLGNVHVDETAVRNLIKLSRNTPKDAVMCDWSICSGAFSRDDPELGKVPVYELIALEAQS